MRERARRLPVLTSSRLAGKGIAALWHTTRRLDLTPFRR